MERLYGGNRGQLIPPKSRIEAVKLIEEATGNGARLKPACEIVGISIRTLQNWRRNGMQDRRQSVKKTPANKLSGDEKKKILKVCNSKEFQNMSPKQIVPALADRGIYYASESSFYRVLREADQLKHRGKTAAPAKRSKPRECAAYGPNQVWSWDITYLKSSIKGRFFYLYLFMDIFSRKIVGWEIYETESAEHASELLKRIRLKEKLPPDHELILHSDNGSPMKGATMLATMEKLGITKSFSRPSVSNDNPYSESLFKTLKYVPVYPSKPFESVEDSRKWMVEFEDWYNNIHRHSSLKFVTPTQRHDGLDKEILKQRKKVYEKAKQNHPERWSGNTRNWDYKNVEFLNPDNKKSKESIQKNAA